MILIFIAVLIGIVLVTGGVMTEIRNYQFRKQLSENYPNLRNLPLTNRQLLARLTNVLRGLPPEGF